MARSIKAAPSIFFVSALVLSAGIARAQGGAKDAEATKLANEAVNSDYLALKFDQAESKLKRALGVCLDGCSKKVIARLHRDLGVVYIAGLDRRDEGKVQFIQALQADPTITLDQDLTTEAIQEVFDEAAAEAGAAEPTAETEAEEPAQPPAEGDLVVSEISEQMVNTPVPIFVEAPEGVRFETVKVRYRPFGATDWKTVEMSRVKDGWGIEIPCLDVTTSGKLDFYVQGYDQGGDVLAEAGSRTQPHHVAIVHELSGDPPHLPGRAPPAQCRDSSDCPPDFPGCGEELDDGAMADSDSSSRSVKNWLSLSFQQDLMLLSSARQVCDEGSDYACFGQEDQYYDIVPLDRAGGEVRGGVSAATSRILVGYDRVLGENISLGVRAGYAFGGGPQAPGGNAFVPIHGEGRVSYWFGKSPFARSGVRPFVQASGGIAQVDSKVDVRVYDNQTQFQADQTTELAAWRKAGTAFASLGGGAAFALTPNHALIAELRLMQMLGVGGTAVGLNVGYGFGL